MQPLHDIVLIEPDDVEATTESGIILAPQAVTKPTTGTVIAVGPKVYGLNPNDRVVFMQHHGEPLGELIYMRFASIIAVL